MWLSHELPARAAPLTLDLRHALPGEAFSLRRGDVTVALLADFEGILRTGELTQLCKGDIDVATDYSTAVLNLGLTKAGSRIDSIETVTLEDPKVVKLLAARLLHLLLGDPLLPKEPLEFQVVLKKLLSNLGLSEAGFTPFSLRRGGTTHHFRKHYARSRTVVKGRWTNARTARVYINEGLAVLASFALLSLSSF